MWDGVEPFELNWLSLTQTHQRTGTSRSLRCTIHAPSHWTHSVSFQAVYNAGQFESVELSGFSIAEFNTIFYKSSSEKRHGYPVWFSRNMDAFICRTRDYNLAIYSTYLCWRDGQPNVSTAMLEGCCDPLQRGRWTEFLLDGDGWKSVKPSVVERPAQCLGASALTNIVVEIVDENMLSKLGSVLRDSATCAHRATSTCDTFKRNLKLVRVLRIENWPLWQRYKNHHDQVKRDLRYDANVKPFEPRAPETLEDFAAICNCSTLDTQTNESLLFHGTSYDNAVKIAEEGFDVRQGKPGYYGRGIYFACQACKSHQYAKPRNGLCTVILSRVLLGDIHYADKVAPSCRRPPAREGTARCCDSVVAKPGPMPGHFQGTQRHQEFVIFDNFQAYPELIIQYTLDA
eukprot:TRINITY_DN73123_c0_g1_i1.p1 TRINITY_DN73123_c0_g1~~TRINITY_DN73123_c0_g1_i1.p1  ORF type:complete len:401 (-),score=24.32 TRINITY_DN73123_c0_g1_i1:228-1430(-)